MWDSRSNSQMTLHRSWVVLVCLVLFSGCVSVAKLGDSPEEVRSVIREGEILRAGDRVVLETTKKREVEFKVSQIDERAIRGDGNEVFIDDVVAAERRRTTLIGKFLWIYGGSMGIPIAIGLILASLNVILASVQD